MKLHKKKQNPKSAHKVNVITQHCHFEFAFIMSTLSMIDIHLLLLKNTNNANFDI